MTEHVKNHYYIINQLKSDIKNIWNKSFLKYSEILKPNKLLIKKKKKKRHKSQNCCHPHEKVQKLFLN